MSKRARGSETTLLNLEALENAVPWEELGADVVDPLRRALDTARRERPATERAKAADAAREATFEALEDEERAEAACAAYSAASILFADATLAGGDCGGGDEAVDSEAAALRACDLAMLRGGVAEWATITEPVVRAASAGAASEARRLAVRAAVPRSEPEPVCEHMGGLAAGIERVDARGLSVADFSRRYLESGTPVILTHAIGSWPARTCRPWSCEYLRALAGERLRQGHG
mmetsp:Transcript_43404/g.140123  ORF Transcript_43404/g.140123 Transcript_43404/m.140123 type:complete len:232 (-) Transcript_43404:13-708(-)